MKTLYDPMNVQPKDYNEKRNEVTRPWALRIEGLGARSSGEALALKTHTATFANL